ncbi:MAG: hypothetical protein ACLU0O_11010 [Collinsella sp.]
MKGGAYGCGFRAAGERQTAFTPTATRRSILRLSAWNARRLARQL